MSSRRILREKKTIAVMVSMYCRAHHAESGGTRAGFPCQGCRGLLAYAEGRIDRCVFRDSKPVCNACRVHCYAREMREEVRAVMRFAGPRMMGSHPLLALAHLSDGFRHRGGRRERTGTASG